MEDKSLNKKLSDQERKELIRYHLAELKKLRATPRSDWHAGFEALLRIETYKYEEFVQINTEEEIGDVPPRTDFVILIKNDEIKFDKAVFQKFRRINILEYKNPHDSLNERVLRKVCGYANLYIGMAEHEKDRPSDQVTISIFRAMKPQSLFNELERRGSLVKEQTPGIYFVTGYTDIPFQIVITDELEGDEYASYRALTDRAEEADVVQILLSAEQEKNEVLLDHYGVLLNLVVEKNPRFFNLVKGEIAMKDVLMEMVKDKVDERVKESKALDIKNLMTNLKLTLDQAMDALSIPQQERSVYADLIQEAL